MNQPIKAIKYHRTTRILAVTFADDEKTIEFSAEFLRVLSPSAEVTGHGPGQEVLVTNKSKVAMTKITPVGNYAVKLHFDDGHDSGLYSWDYFIHLRNHKDHLWQDYLTRLKAANAHREEIIPIQIK